MGNTIICYQYSMSAKSYIVLTILLLGLALSVSAKPVKKGHGKKVAHKMQKGKRPAFTPNLPAGCRDPCKPPPVPHKPGCPKLKCKPFHKGFKTIKHWRKIKG